jgi:hypothetical protein
MKQGRKLFFLKKEAKTFWYFKGVWRVFGRNFGV